MHPIERYRAARGWTQDDLAQRAGVSVHTVRAWEKGAMPRPANLRKLALLFEIDLIRLVDAIIGWRPESDGEISADGQHTNVNVSTR